MLFFGRWRCYGTRFTPLYKHNPSTNLVTDWGAVLACSRESFPCFPFPVTQFAAACGRVLGSALAFTPDDSLTRQVGQKRKYSTTRVARPKQPARALKVIPVESIADGTCFPEPKRALAEGEPRTCCRRECNVTFTVHDDSIARVRSRVPKPGEGQQAARKVFVKSCIQADKTLSLNDFAGLSAVVCQLFFVAVTGCSKKLISSAMGVGPTGM